MSARDVAAELLRPPERTDVGGWILRAGVALLFVGVGWAKFQGNPHGDFVRIFTRLGVEPWGRYATGVIEVVGGVLYLFPLTCRPAALALACTMLGAMVAWLTVLGNAFFAIVPLILLVAVVTIALREPDPEFGARLSARGQASTRGAARPPPRR